MFNIRLMIKKILVILRVDYKIFYFLFLDDSHTMILYAVIFYSTLLLVRTIH